MLTTNDAIGLETMSPAMEGVSNYYDWIYDKIRPYLGTRVLEVGPGYGNIAERILKDGKHYTGVDSDQKVISRLAARLPAIADQFKAGDVTDARSLEELRSFRPDTILSMNVLEHIQDDRAHLASLVRQPLAPRFVLFVPAMEFLYGTFDEEAGHYRRYTLKSIRKLIADVGLKLRYETYMNGLGAFAWWGATRVLRMHIEDEECKRSIGYYDKYFVPLARSLDPAFSRFIGQSIIAVADV